MYKARTMTRGGKDINMGAMKRKEEAKERKEGKKTEEKAYDEDEEVEE